MIRERGDFDKKKKSEGTHLDRKFEALKHFGFKGSIVHRETDIRETWGCLLTIPSHIQFTE